MSTVWLAVSLAILSLTATDAGDGSWRLEYPPWGEHDAATAGAPPVWLPLIGPFTKHGCFPSRYMSMRIAVSHVNRRDATFCPAIGSLVNSFELRYDMRDTGGSGTGAASAILDFFANSSVMAKIKVLLGPNGSGASKASSSILSVFGIPQISWASTNAELSNKVNYPQYFRTVSPDSLVMRVLAGLVANLGFTKANCIYFDATFQSGQASDFISPAESEFGIQVSKYVVPNSGESGAAVSDANRVVMDGVLEAVKLGGCRVVAAFSINEEAWDLWSAAHAKGIVNDHGWLWLGGDGVAGAQLAGDPQRLYAFVGTIYVFPSSRGPQFEGYATKWAEDMPSTATPEFTDMELCRDNSGGGPPMVCTSNPDFKGWVPGQHDQQLLCQGYTALAYDAVVTLAVVADKLITKTGKQPDELTREEWLQEMRSLSEPGQSFDCLSGELTYNQDQERLLPMNFWNYQNGSTQAVHVARWSLASGYSWQVGAQVQWPDGQTVAIESAGRPSLVPSGLAPECAADEYYSYKELQCIAMCAAGEEPDQSGECQSCPAARFKPFAGQQACQACSAGRKAASTGTVLCSECGPGTFQELDGQEQCNQCPNGTFAAQPASTACAGCAAGTFSGAPGAQVCAPCGPGKFQSSQGQEECEQCAAGSFTSDEGSISCRDCSAGTASSSPGAHVCAECPVGFFQDLVRQTECKKCAAGITLEWTLVEAREQWVPFEGAANASACGCPANSMPDASGACAPCGEAEDTGIICRGKDDIIIAPGFYAEDDTLSVFKCFGLRSRCTGGRPGETCASGREGVTCNRCKPGMQEDEGGICSPCSEGSAATVFVVAVVLGLFVLSAMYFFIDRRGSSQQSHTLVLCALVVSIAVTVLQQIGILGMLDKIEWEEPMATVLSWTKVLTFDVSALQLNCVFGTSPLAKYTFQVGIVFVCLLLLLAYHFAAVVVCHGGNFSARWPSLIASVGTITQVFYIAVITTMLGPFQCLESPNGRWTARGYQSVICWDSGEHDAMIAIGVVAAIFPIAYLVKCAQVVTTFPARMKSGDVSLLRSYAFLFFRYKPECYWYSLVHMARSLVLGLTPIVPQVSAQILIMQVTLMVQLVCTVSWSPWRVRQATHIDIFSTCMIMTVLGCASFYVEVAPGKALAVFALLGIIFVLFLFLFFAIFKVVESAIQKNTKPFKYFLCHHKAAAGSCARLLKMQLAVHVGTRQKIFLDCDDLTDLATLFETVRSQVGTLVILCTKEVLLRPWCMGEVATTHHCGIDALKVRFPDFSDPDEDYIKSYETASPDFTILTSHGISLQEVQAALRWVPTINEILPNFVSDADMKSLAGEIRFGEVPSSREAPVSPTSTRSNNSRKTTNTSAGSMAGITTWITFDESSWEAAAAAAVLSWTLREHFVHSAADTPHVLQPNQELPQDTRRLVVLCSPGALQEPSVLSNISKAVELSATCFPVVVDEGFRFPTQSFTEENHSIASVVSPDPTGLLEEVRSLFQTIAGSFLASCSSQTVLSTKASEIALRLQSMSERKSSKASTAKQWKSESTTGTQGTKPEVKAQLSDREEAIKVTPLPLASLPADQDVPNRPLFDPAAARSPNALSVASVDYSQPAVATVSGKKEHVTDVTDLEMQVVHLRMPDGDELICN